ncbi:PIR protein, pseudogene, putative [Plasmodium sp.]|nr:PIR protein, pseudogene, putative [Plasmodium sp.]
MLLFVFSFILFLLSENVKCQNNNYNIRLTQNKTQRKTTKSRFLAEIESHNNPHYHNDPELKKIIDELNEEAIKKYKNSHDSYEQLHELLQKKGKPTTGARGEEHISKIEKELLKTYEEMLGDESYINLKYGMYTNNDVKSNGKNDKPCAIENKKKSSNKLTSSNKVHDNYLDNLKSCCVGAVNTCALSSILTGYFGVLAGAEAAVTSFPALSSSITSASIGIKFFFISVLEHAIKTATHSTLGSIIETFGVVEGAASAGTLAFFSYGMAIVALIAVTVIVILLYVWLRKRRKNSWKYECKKHLCT